jgi:hypothetical protein
LIKISSVVHPSTTELVMAKNRCEQLGRGCLDALATAATEVVTDERNERQLSSSRFGRLNSLRLSFATLGTVLAVSLGCASVATAAPSAKEPVEPPTPVRLVDTKGNSPCSFPVDLLVITNKEVTRTFDHRIGVTHITGALKVRLVNADTNKAIDRNISGPIFLTKNIDGSTTQKTTGAGLWVFDPGVAPEFPSHLIITKGKTESIIGPAEGAFTFVGRQGSFEDICAALGA